jgi:diguanylate cyclase (GGDEF)-like protein
MYLDRPPARPSPNSPAGIKQENKRLRQENKELKNQALVDPLTGLYNRRYLNLQLENCSKAGNIKGITSLIFDVDNFGDYNKNLIETHGKEKGHFLGDKILQKIANVLSESIEATDILVRFGGDEFVAVFPNLIDTDNVQRLVYRLHNNIEENLIENGIHVSFGFATTIKENLVGSQDFFSTLQEADNHLLEMKKYKNIL